MSHDGGNRVTPTSDRRPNDGSTGGSRPSKNNRQGHADTANASSSDIKPDDLPGGVGLRPISVEPDVSLRDEGVMIETEEGHILPACAKENLQPGDSPMGRPMYRVVDAWREWMKSYRNSHIEYENPAGETVRAPLENSYQQGYNRRYYARLKDGERGIERVFSSVTTAMLTFTGSHENAHGHPRCPGDHMRDVISGWNTARKQLHQVLSDVNWEYARVLEPHEDGYGHLHIAVFVDDPDNNVTAEDFGPVMESHCRTVTSAGTDAHKNTPCTEHAEDGRTRWDSVNASCDNCHRPVSVRYEIETIAGYISEYLGIYGEEPLERSMSEQTFMAVTWATNTRRLDFSNGLQDIISQEQFMRETGLRAEDRGSSGVDENGNQTATDEATEWDVDSICHVVTRRPKYTDPTTGGIEMTVIDGKPGTDPPAERE